MITDSSSSTSSESSGGVRLVTIGILALQGAFEEHADVFKRLGYVRTVEVRQPYQLEGLDGIVLPGGESTAMALISDLNGMFGALRKWISPEDGSPKRPVWGTCAGMILLSEGAKMQKQGGQVLIGGLNVEVCRNYFGSQSSSFEIPIDTSSFLTASPPSPSSSSLSSDVILDDESSPHNVFNTDSSTKKRSRNNKKFPTNTNSSSPNLRHSILNNDARHGPHTGVFIRAPAVLSVGDRVEILATVRVKPCKAAAEALGDDFLGSTRHAGTDLSTKTLLVDPSHSPSPSPSPSVSPKRQKIANKAVVNGKDAAVAAVPAPTVVVAVRQENILATAFHPEITDDVRWHKYFVDEFVMGYLRAKETMTTAAAAAVAK